MEFENNEYKIIDIQKSLQNEQGLLKDLCNDINVFMSAELDEVAGTIRWSSGVDFENNFLYEKSQDLDMVMKGNRSFPNPRKITRLGDNSQSRLSKENQRLIKLIRG